MLEKMGWKKEAPPPLPPPSFSPLLTLSLSNMRCSVLDTAGATILPHNFHAAVAAAAAALNAAPAKSTKKRK